MAKTISQLLQDEPCPECGLPGLCKCKQGVKRPHKKDVKHSRARSQSQEYGVRDSYRKVGFQKTLKVPMSGGIATMKGDVSVEDFMLVECKESRQGNLLIKQAWVDKVAKEAKDAGKQWYALHAWIAEEEDNYRKVVIVPEKLWFEILEVLKSRDLV